MALRLIGANAPLRTIRYTAVAASSATNGIACSFEKGKAPRRIPAIAIFPNDSWSRFEVMLRTRSIVTAMRHIDKSSLG